MIHLLGAGSIGSLVAVNLAKKQVPVTLLLRGSSHLKAFTKADKTMSLKSKGETHTAKFQAVVEPDRIENLIVCLKCQQIKQALTKYLPSISPGTTILVVHNGMGVEEEIASLWPQPASRPRIIYGLTSMGSKRLPFPWAFEHTGTTPIYLSGRDMTKAPGGKLVGAMVESNTIFSSMVLPYGEFLSRQYEKLVVNSVINPMTAILGVPNGDLIKYDQGAQLERLTRESCSVIASYAAEFEPEHKHMITQALDERRMFRIVQEVCRDTAANTSSMRADVESGRATEVDYINGYIVQLAKKVGRSAQQNRVMRNLVKMKEGHTKWMLESGYVPSLDIEA